MKRELKRPVGSFLYRKIHRFLNMRTIRERMRKIHVVPEDESLGYVRNIVAESCRTVCWYFLEHWSYPLVWQYIRIGQRLRLY